MAMTRRALSALAAGFLFVAPSIASAQIELTPEEAVYAGMLTSSTTTIVTMVPLSFTVYGAGHREWEWLLLSSSTSLQTTSEFNPPSTRKRRRRRVLNYIQRNESSVRQELVLGEAASLRDVASLLEVPEADREDFVMAAREARAAYAPLFEADASLEALDVALVATARAFLERRARI